MLSLDEHNAFVTVFITRPDLRGRGIGRRVWDACSATTRGKNLVINAAPNREAMYNRLGFVASKDRMLMVDHVFAMKRAASRDEPRAAAPLVDYSPDLFDRVYAYDQSIQPLERRVFVRNHLDKSDVVKVAFRDDAVVGYACLRKNFKGFMIMPLYADSPDIARLLLHGVAENVEENEQIKIGIPGGNPAAEEIFKAIGWFERPYNPLYVNLRMHTSIDYADVIDQSKVYSAMNYSYVLI